VRKTNRELYDCWITRIDAVDALRLVPDTTATKRARETAREALQDAADELTARIRQSLRDA
jgi:hypothetical protein